MVFKLKKTQKFIVSLSCLFGLFIALTGHARASDCPVPDVFCMLNKQAGQAPGIAGEQIRQGAAVGQANAQAIHQNGTTERANNDTDNEYAQGTTAATTQGSIIEFNNATIKLAQASDDLADGITIAVMTYYAKRTPDEMLADIMEEGKSYGYVSDAGVVSENEPDHFSLISKANAAINVPNLIFGLMAHNGTSDISGLTTRYGGSYTPGRVSLAQDRFRGPFWAAKLTYVLGLIRDAPKGNVYCPSSAQCNLDKATYAGAQAHHGAIFHHTMRVAVHHASPRNASQVRHVGSLDWSSFLIASAYAATADDSSGSQLPALQQAHAQASANTCTPALKIGVLEVECGAGASFGQNNLHFPSLIAKAYASSGTTGPSAAEAEHAFDCPSENHGAAIAPGLGKFGTTTQLLTSARACKSSIDND